MSWSFKQKLDTSDPIFTATARLLGSFGRRNHCKQYEDKKEQFKQDGIDDYFNGWTISPPSKHSSQRISNLFFKEQDM